MFSNVNLYVVFISELKWKLKNIPKIRIKLLLIRTTGKYLNNAIYSSEET